MGRKVKVHDFAPGRGMGREREFRVSVTVKRTAGEPAKHAFYACAIIHKSGHRRVINRYYEDRAGCAYGPAPRRALANALKHLGQSIVKRSSSFRGVR